MTPVIPPQRNRKVAREYDAALYQARHLVENGFERFKARRGVATRYAKNAAAGVSGDLLDTGFGCLGQANMTTPTSFVPVGRARCWCGGAVLQAGGQGVSYGN